MSMLPHSRRGALWRFALAAFIVIAFTASATAVAGLLKVKQFVNELNYTPPLPHARVVIPRPGEPQTILLIGSDHRAGTSFRMSNTDTMMLVRIDASSSTINVLSIPRDLKVNLPYGNVMGPGKLNAAYSIGGPNLLVKTLHDQVLPGLKINHIIDVNFGGFEALINAVGCVYADVDHRYYNNTAFTNYSSIDIQPGYQRLCGADALSFVRFRHTDSDLVRNARQQDFLRWAKSQFSSDTIISQQDKLLTIFGKHAQTDAGLHTTDGLLNLFNLIAFSAGHTVKQIPFPAIFLSCNSTGQAQTPCYVGAQPAALAKTYAAFLTPTKAAPPAKKSSGGGGHGGGHGGGSAPANLTGDLADGKAQAGQMGNAGMTVFVPGTIASGSHYCAPGLCSEGPIQNSYPRRYRIKDRGGHWHAAYRLTLVLNPLLGQYYGVQGMTWNDPPILSGPHDTRSVNGKQLLIYYNGKKATLVAWHGSGGLYWISNTLTDDLSNQQIIAIAGSLTHA